MDFAFRFESQRKVDSVELLRALVSWGVPYQLRPEVMPGFKGIDLITKKRLAILLDQEVTEDLPQLLSINLSLSYSLAGIDPNGLNQWVTLVVRDKSEAEVIFLVTLEAFRLRFADSLELRLNLTDRQEKECLKSCIRALKLQHPIRYMEILRAGGLLKSGEKSGS